MHSGRRRIAITLSLVAAGLAGEAPAFALPPPEAGPPDLASYRGKVVYVDFWASWCVPCRQSFPWMNAMHRKYGKDGLVVLAVNMDQVRDDAEAFLRKYPAEFSVHFDPQGKLAEGFKLRGMPTSALLGRDGRLLLVHQGFRSTDPPVLEQSIRDALR